MNHQPTFAALVDCHRPNPTQAASRLKAVSIPPSSSHSSRSPIGLHPEPTGPNRRTVCPVPDANRGVHSSAAHEGCGKIKMVFPRSRAYGATLAFLHERGSNPMPAHRAAAPRDRAAGREPPPAVDSCLETNRRSALPQVRERRGVILHLGPSRSGDATNSWQRTAGAPQHVVVAPEIGDISDQRSNVCVLPPPVSRLEPP